MPDELAQRAARLHNIGRQSVHFDIALIAKNKARLVIEHQQTLRHVVDGRIDPHLLFKEAFVGTHSLGHVERRAQARRAARICEIFGIDGNHNAGSVSFPVTPDFMTLAPSAFLNASIEMIAIFRKPKIEHSHLQKRILRISVMRHGGGIDGQKFLRIDIHHPHRNRIAIKQQSK